MGKYEENTLRPPTNEKMRNDLKCVSIFLHRCQAEFKPLYRQNEFYHNNNITGRTLVARLVI